MVLLYYGTYVYDTACPFWDNRVLYLNHSIKKGGKNVKKQNSRFLAFVLALVMAFSTIVYVSAADGSTGATPSGEWSLSSTTKGQVIADTAEVKITALTAISGGKSSVSNHYFVNSEKLGSTFGSTRPYLQIEPKVDGNALVTVDIPAGKSSWFLEPTGVEGTYDNNGVTATAEIANPVSQATGPVPSAVGFLNAGKTYLFAPVGTNPKFTKIAFYPGSTPMEQEEPSTETTTEAQQVEVEDIRTMEKPIQSKADDGAKHTLWVLGDSTACYYGTDSGYITPRNGFGMALGDDAANNYVAQYKIFDNENLEVRNLAISGISSLNFRTNTNYNTLINNWKPGDYVIIAFGHNDQKLEAERFTNASMGAEGWNMTGQFANSFYQYYILPAYKAGVTPILATSIIRRASGTKAPSGAKIHDLTSSGYGNYRQTVIDLANMFGLSVLDNTYYTYMEHITLGAGNDDGTTGYAVNHALQKSGTVDDTHVNATGSRMIAYFMAQAMQGKEIKYGVTATGSTGIASALTDGTANNDGALTSLATFLGPDANTDPRTKEFDNGEVDPDAFRIYFDYAGDAGKLQVGNEFNMDCNVVNNKGISKVDMTVVYNEEEMTPVTGKDITDKNGNVIITADAYKAAVDAKTSVEGSGILYGIKISADLSNVASSASVTADTTTLFSLPFKLVKRGESTIKVNDATVYDPTGNAYTGDDVITQGGQINVDSDITDPGETVIKGDADGKNGLTANDAAIVLASVKDPSIAAKYDLSNCDVDGAAGITATDAAQILAKVLDPTYELGKKA